MQLPDKPTPYFQERYLPPDTHLVGASALVRAFDVPVPVRSPAVVSEERFKGSIKHQDGWHIFDSKYAVEPTVDAHLTFAIKNENWDLLVFKRIFLALPEEVITDFVKAAPLGPVTRRVWFLYEFLTERKLPIADSGKVTAVELLDSKRYCTSPGTISTRHKVRNNLLGTRRLCPIIRRTEKLEALIARQLSTQARVILEHVSPQLVARAASFLLLADSQASFAIEGERLPRNKEERWLRAVQQVGKHPLSINELNRLHEILIEDRRFIKAGLRSEGVFLGQRTTDGVPLPEFIGARSQDLDDLVDALIETDSALANAALDPVLQAACTAFAFVYIHPYEDGNGRLHRCLIHHALAARNFSPQGLVFPVSSVMLKRINSYRETLQNHSRPLMSFIDWVPTNKGNVEVTNDTSDLYRYFDCTEAAEFLYECVESTVEHDVPEELEYLKRHDRAISGIMNKVEMPDRLAEDFLMFMRQNEWRLPKRRREKEFEKLTDTEVTALEDVVRDAFEVNT
ncbi:MAG TPA: Fic family protein [Candidatus Obscuribacterales bacterium]